MLIVVFALEIVFLGCIYVTKKIYKNGNTILISNDSEFIETLPEDLKGEFIQESRMITLRMYYCFMVLPPIVYGLYKCNFKTLWLIIFTVVLVGIIMIYILNHMIRLQHEYREKIKQNQ